MVHAKDASVACFAMVCPRRLPTALAQLAHLRVLEVGGRTLNVDSPRVCRHSLEMRKPRQAQQQVVQNGNACAYVREGKPRNARPGSPEPCDQHVPHHHPVCQRNEQPSDNSESDAQYI
mmetsp:Transcript_123144/g.239354  ORF Transcript_123144/g.239354 Transcript_123144/m.239354 type:complete len:119 (+) Transcript_123144:645-1001(+)